MKQLNVFKAALLILVFASSISLQAKDIPITVTQLPAKAQTLLKTHFPKQNVVYVIKDQGLINTDYEVKLDNFTDIEFDANGNWTEVDGDDRAIPTGFIPNSIVTYVKSNFPNMNITKIEKSRRKYEVELNGDIEIEFDLNGNFLRIDN